MVESVMAYSVGDTYTQSQMTSLLDAKSPVSTTGLVLLASQTIGSAVTSVTVNNAFNANYESYKIMISGGVGSASCEFLFTLGTSATAYYSAVRGYRYSNSDFTYAYANNGSSIWVGGAHTSSLNLSMEVTNPYLAKRSLVSANGIDNVAAYYAAGFHDSAVSYTDFKITVGSGGNITGGTIKVYGYK
jgi:hypothetical protein